MLTVKSPDVEESVCENVFVRDPYAARLMVPQLHVVGSHWNFTEMLEMSMASPIPFVTVSA